MRKFILILIVFFLAIPVFAEEIVLKSGQVLEAPITEKSEKFIKVDLNGMSVTYYLDEVESIDGQAVEINGIVEGFVEPVDAAEEEVVSEGLITPDEPLVELEEVDDFLASRLESINENNRVDIAPVEKEPDPFPPSDVPKKEAVAVSASATSSDLPVPVCPLPNLGAKDKAAALKALREKFSPFNILFSILSYFYYSLCLYLIAKKTNTEPAWLAWIPPLNFMFLMLKIAGVSYWWLALFLFSPVLMFFAPMLVLLFGLGALIFGIFISCKIATAVKKPWWLGILMCIPIVSLVTYPVIFGYLAFSKE